MTSSLERLALVAAVLAAVLAITRPVPVARFVETDEGVELVIGLCFRPSVLS
jgi:hypothetical protein